LVANIRNCARERIRVDGGTPDFEYSASATSTTPAIWNSEPTRPRYKQKKAGMTSQPDLTFRLKNGKPVANRICLNAIEIGVNTL
jgi:hypothetical protein